MSNEKIFSGNQYYFVFIKIRVSLKKTVLSSVQKKLSVQTQYRNQLIDHFANQLTGFNMVRFFTD